MNALTAPHPYYICTAEQCRQMDTTTIEEFGIDGFTLMEIAGSTTAGHLLTELPAGSHGLYLCGKGNNAGDALVVARYLVQHGHRATLVFLSGTDDLSSDTSHNLSLLEKIDSNDGNAPGITFLETWERFETANGAGSASDFDYDFIVDGMLGTGLSSDLRGDYADAVDFANRSKLPVYSIDIPTGLHSDSGQIMGNAIRAVKTFTYGARKQGLYLDNGYECTGSIVYCELPFPNYLKTGNTFLLDDSWVEEPGISRGRARHKYEAGVLYVVAGSEGLTGAALMTAQSAWAEGIGAVIVICPRGILSVFENNAPQIIKKPVGKRGDFDFEGDHLDEVLAIIGERPGQVLFGPGIGRASATLDFADGFFSEFEGKLLVDADGLWCLAQQGEWEKPADAEWIITPHPGELSALTGSQFTNGEERLDRTRKLSSEKDITVVSKGFPSIVGTPDGKCYLTGYDTRIFARAGFGDVLSGKIGAYWALENTPAASAALGLLNGYKKASDARESGKNILEPKDLI